MLPRLIALLLVITLAVPMLIAQQKANADDRISDDVRQRLASNADVRGAALDVTVKDGVVTIKGRVHTDKGQQEGHGGSPRKSKAWSTSIISSSSIAINR